MAEDKDIEKTLDVPDEVLNPDGSVVIDEKTGEIIPPAKEDKKAESDETDEQEEQALKADEQKGDETLEDMRARRKQEKHDRRERGKIAREARERELRETKRALSDALQRIDAVEKRTNSGELARLDSAITDADGYAQMAKKAVDEAITNQNGAAFSQAQEAWFEARTRAENLKRIKQGMEQTRQQEAVRPPKPPPEQERLARRWMNDNAWYKADDPDDDSEIMLACDRRVLRRGLDPSTPEYWDALTKEGKKFLPHRFMKTQARDEADDEDDDIPPKKPNGEHRQITAGSSRESGGPKTGFRLSKERVDAMREAGVWDDAKARARQIAAFQKYDKEHPPETRH